MAPARKALLRILLALIGVGIVVYLVARIGPHAIAAHLSNVGLDFAWLVAAYAAGTTVSALPWYWLLPAHARPRLTGAVASRFAASGANAVLPFFAIGGEPSRLLWLRPAHHAAGLAGVVVDRLLFAGASVLFLLAGLIAVLQIHALPQHFVVLGAALAASALVGASVLAYLVANHGIAGRIHRLVHRLRSAPSANFPGGALGDGIDERLEILLKRRRERLAASTLIHFVARALLGAEIYVGLLVVGATVSPAEGLILASVPVALAFVGSWIPSQIGLQEGAVAFVCSVLGIDPAAGLTVVVLQRIRQVGFVGLAWALVSRAAARGAGAESERADGVAAAADPDPDPETDPETDSDTESEAEADPEAASGPIPFDGSGARAPPAASDK